MCHLYDYMARHVVGQGGTTWHDDLVSDDIKRPMYDDVSMYVLEPSFLLVHHIPRSYGDSKSSSQLAEKLKVSSTTWLTTWSDLSKPMRRALPRIDK